MGQSVNVSLPDAAATERFGAGLAAAILGSSPDALVVYLVGDLGSGKTTLVRGLLAALGHRGRVPSPTYTLVEPYVLGGYRVLHLDLYRLRDPAELLELGLGDEFSGRFLAFIEWPDHGGSHLPAADLTVHLGLAGHGRVAELQPHTTAGAAIARVAGQGQLPSPFLGLSGPL